MQVRGINIVIGQHLAFRLPCLSRRSAPAKAEACRMGQHGKGCRQRCLARAALAADHSHFLVVLCLPDGKWCCAIVGRTDSFHLRDRGHGFAPQPTEPLIDPKQVRLQFVMPLDQNVPGGVGLGVLPLERNPSRDRNTRGICPVRNDAVFPLGAIHDNPRGNTHLKRHCRRQLQVIQSERRRLGEQHRHIRAFKRLDHWARGSGGGVQDIDCLRVDMLLDGLYHIGRKRFTDVQEAVREEEGLVCGRRPPARLRRSLDFADGNGFFAKCVFRAHEGASAAGMAKFIEDEHLAFDHGDRVVVAGFGALSAAGALLLVPYRFQHGNVRFLGEIGLHEQVIVWFLNVAVQ